MAQRLELDALLRSVLGSDNVYFQPPPNTMMEYPCIIYKRDTGRTVFAGNRPYRFKMRYLVTYLDKDPDNPVHEKLVELPMCIFDRHYTANGLNHDVFSLYF